MTKETAQGVTSVKTAPSVDKFFSTFAKEFPTGSQATASILLRTYADGLRDMGMMQKNETRSDVTVSPSAP